jgi:hypothetical protein
MKLFFALAVAASFLIGIFGGLLLGATRAPQPGSIPDSQSISGRVSEPGPDPGPAEVPTGMPQAPVRMQMPPARHEAPPISVVIDTSSEASAPASDPLGPDDETLSARLAIERDQSAMRAWLPFRHFVQQHAIDTRSLADATVKALFDRYAELYEQRTAEMIRIAKPHMPDEVEGERRSNQGEPMAVDAVEARFAVGEEALALEFRGR